MAQAKRDNNSIPTIIAALNTDGETPINVTIDPTTHVIDVDDDTTGSDIGSDEGRRDDNVVVGMLAVSESDGTTPVPLWADSSGNLLIDSN